MHFPAYKVAAGSKHLQAFLDVAPISGVVMSLPQAVQVAA